MSKKKAPRGILCDRSIMELCLWHGMLDPFTFGDGVDHLTPNDDPHSVRRPAALLQEAGKISGGLSSYGYDIRLAGEFKIFTNSAGNVLIDPKKFDERSFVSREATRESPVVIIPPHGFALGRSLEKFRMPDDVMGIALGKSTYARCGIALNITPAEPGWSGHLTIEISNHAPLPGVLYAFEGISQIVFFEGEPCMRNYRTKVGKYQDQVGVTLPIVR